MRPYDHERDFERVGRFLIEVYEPGPLLRNWLQPRWEYMFSLNEIDDLDLGTIGIAEESGEIVAVVHPEDRAAFCYFQIRHGNDHVKARLLDWAEEKCGGWSIGLEQNVLGLWIDEHDAIMAGLAQQRGFRLDRRFTEPHAQRSLVDRLPEAPLPAGFSLRSLADDNDYRKIHQVLWRGFNHAGPPPDDGVAHRVRAQNTPGFRRDLTIVVVAPNEDYVTFAGTWLVPENAVAYVEPVATDPDYRRLGLGRAAVVETLRRARADGVQTAWVGSDQEFYRSFGFRVTCQTNMYVRLLD